MPPWTDMVEVYWSASAEAYVTPVSPDTVGVALLFAKPPRTAAPDADGTGPRGEAGTEGDYDARLAAFPALLDRLGGAPSASEVRGAGPLRHDVARRVYGRVLLVGDASGYLDALTGEGLGVGLAQADALAAASRPAAPRSTSAPGGASPARRGGSPRACSGHGTSRCSARASSPPRSGSRGSCRPSSTMPPRPSRRAGPAPRPWLRSSLRCCARAVRGCPRPW